MIAQISARFTNYESSWPQFYFRWLMFNSMLAFLVTAIFLFIPSRIVSLVVVMLFIGFGLLFLFQGGRRIGRVFGLSNSITSIRSMVALGLMGWLLLLEFRGISLGPSQMWSIFILLVIAELSDLFDGYVARRLGPTEFGAVWDMENDVSFSFVLCFLIYTYGGLGPWILLSTLIRHGYILIFRFQNDPPRCPSTFKWFAKTVCAFQLIALISVFVPLLSLQFKATINIVSIILLFISFAWDLFLRYSSDT